MLALFLLMATAIKTSITTTASPMSTTLTLVTVHSSVPSSIPTNTFDTPVFVYPVSDPQIIHIQTPLLNGTNVTINCTVRWEEELSQLTPMWSYNGTVIRGSQDYTVSGDHLVMSLIIRQFTQEDFGRYTCTIRDPSGWTGSHQYFITTKGKTTTLSISLSTAIHLKCVNF